MMPLDQVLPPSATVTSEGHLSIGGCDLVALAEEHGTPLVVYDEGALRAMARAYRDAFAALQPEAEVIYASKAYFGQAMLRLACEEGLSVDVASGGELFAALQAGFPPERITMHGNNKSLAELDKAVQVGVGHIVIDSYEEIARLGFLADKHGVRPKVMIRVTVGVEAHTHEFIATAHDDQKFGLSLSSGAAAEAVRRILALPQLELVGLHSHIGSQITDTGGFEVAARRLARLLVEIKEEHGVVLPELDLGGGYGIPYVAGDESLDVKVIADGLREIVAKVCESAALPVPRLTVEPGRSIAGVSGVTLYEAGTVKDVEGLRTYVSVDGGMSDNIRTALYGADYTAVLASRVSEAAPMLSRLVGKHCESGDMVVRDLYLPGDLAPGDLIAVAGTGAYCRSLSNNYNYLPRPAVVAVSNGRARVIIRGETEDDLLRGQL